MLWEILLGIHGAILLLVVLSFLVTGLTNFYQDLFEKLLRHKISRPDLLPTFSRFAAIATIAVVLGIALSLRIANTG